MTSSKPSYSSPNANDLVVNEAHIEQQFIDKLKALKYTITHAIEDKNVLKFHVDYFKVAAASSSSPNQNVAAASSSPPNQNVAGASSSQAYLKREQDAPATWEYFNP